MQNCKLEIYSFLHVNIQFKKLSKLSKDERNIMYQIKFYNKNNENQSLRVKLEQSINMDDDYEYFFYFCHSYTIIIDNRNKFLKLNEKLCNLFFKLMPYKSSDAPIINIEQIGWKPVILNQLDIWQQTQNCNIPKGKLVYIQRDKKLTIRFQNRLDFQELILYESIIGSSFLSCIENLDEEVQKFYQLLYEPENPASFRKVVIKDCAIIQGCFLQSFQQLDTFISINSYYSEFTLIILQELPFLRKIVWINDSDSITLSDYEKQVLIFEPPLIIIDQFKKLKILKIQVWQLHQIKVQCKIINSNSLQKFVIQVKNNKTPSLIKIINVLNDFDTDFQIIPELNSLLLIEGSFMMFARQNITSIQSIIDQIPLKYQAQIRIINKSKSKSKLTLEINYQEHQNLQSHVIKVKNIPGCEQKSSVFYFSS